MNNKGFAITGILYTLLLVFVTILLMLLFNFQNKKNILDRMKLDALDDLSKYGIDAGELIFESDYEEWVPLTVKEALDALKRMEIE